MSHSDFERLAATLRHDPTLYTEVREQAGDVVSMLEWARKKGYSITRTEAADLVAGLDELTDDELEKAAGGDDPWAPKG